MKRTVFSLLTGIIIGCTLLGGVAYAAGLSNEVQVAAEYLREQGILCGDESGDLMLKKGLSRAELATLLTRLHSQGEVDPSQYTWACYYTDVPEWAKPYVGYCTANLLVNGYGNMLYGASDPVTPAAACTVLLRLYGFGSQEGCAWDYSTACNFAVDLGILYESVAKGDTITRGDMAVLICRAMRKQENTSNLPQFPLPDGTITNPDGSIISKTVTKPAWSRYDFSLEANPAIFTGNYSRAWYNAIRQSIVDRSIILAGDVGSGVNLTYAYAHTLVPDQPADSFAAFTHVLGRIGGLYDFALGAEPYTKNQYEYPGYAIIKVLPICQTDAPLAYIRPELNDLAGRTDRDKVIALNLYLCALMEYDKGKVAGVGEIFSQHTSPVYGTCSSYARAFSLLCDAAGIPCITVSSQTHSWNEVYVDGQWLTVDVSSNDALGGNAKDAYLLTTRAPGIDRMPAGTQFARELLVPGSTMK